MQNQPTTFANQPIKGITPGILWAMLAQTVIIVGTCMAIYFKNEITNTVQNLQITALQTTVVLQADQIKDLQKQVALKQDKPIR